MTKRDIERAIWAMLAEDLSRQSCTELMERAGWVPDTVPPKEVRRWSRAMAHVSGILARRTAVRTRSPRMLAGQMTLGEALR